jgi:hypothetical protein
MIHPSRSEVGVVLADHGGRISQRPGDVEEVMLIRGKSTRVIEMMTMFGFDIGLLQSLEDRTTIVITSIG